MTIIHLDRAHNRILHVLSTSGIFGGISLIALWTTILFLLMKKIFSNFIFFGLCYLLHLYHTQYPQCLFFSFFNLSTNVLIISLLSKSSTLKDISNVEENNKERFQKILYQL